MHSLIQLAFAEPVETVCRRKSSPASRNNLTNCFVIMAIVCIRFLLVFTTRSKSSFCLLFVMMHDLLSALKLHQSVMYRQFHSSKQATPLFQNHLSIIVGVLTSLAYFEEELKIDA